MRKKIAFITGASRGIGRTTAELFAKKGFQVIATGRNPGKATPFNDPSILFLPLDVTDPHSVKKSVEQAIQMFGRIDVLINNAGYGLFSPVELADDLSVQKQFDVNLFGVLRMIRAVVPHMRACRSGNIVNISSIAGICSSPNFGIYSGTKHALEAISQSLAVNLIPWNIHVTLVEPGPVATDFFDKMEVVEKNAVYQKMIDQSLAGLQEHAQERQSPEEVAKVILEVVESETPAIRVQTSPRLKELAAQFVVDPSGNRWFNEQKGKLL